MKLHEIKTTSGSTHSKKRVGRGMGSGLGKTSGRGEKGQKARSGGKIPAYFEGGQIPLYKRVRGKGFNNKQFETKYATVNVEKLNVFKDGEEVTLEKLLEKRIINKTLDGVKILGGGKLDRKLTVKANVFTNSAICKIEELGGKAEVI